MNSYIIKYTTHACDEHKAIMGYWLCYSIGMATWVEVPTEALPEALSEARSEPTGHMQE